MNMSKSGKNAYFRHVFAINFFVHFLKTFPTDLKSAWKSAFFYTHIEFLKTKIFLLLLAFFLNFECKCAQDGSKHVLEFN
jgi:hypothetical protein